MTNHDSENNARSLTLYCSLLNFPMLEHDASLGMSNKNEMTNKSFPVLKKRCKRERHYLSI